jgi:hypothetical protein
MNGGEKVGCSSVVSGCDASKMLELIEESLDAVPEFVGLDVVWDLDFSVTFGGNNSFYIGLLDHFTQRIGVVRLVSDDAVGSLTLQQIGSRGDIMCLPTRQNKA